MILPQCRQRLPSDLAGRGEHLEALTGQHDVARRLGELGSASQRDRDISAGEHRRVVDAVADRDNARPGRLERREPGPEQFVWTGSTEQKGRYVPRGLIGPGQRVRVTRRPVEELSEHGSDLLVVTRGEVIPDES